ncbi:MAG: PH domain-containing protein [Deltaproteobacteria bacterium]|nr:PH domain-containing protein [Deltaproteobacteria bacterium]
MGKYVQGNLLDGEWVVYEARLHWIVFVSLRAVLTLFTAPLIDYLTSEFAITNKRVIIKLGLISIHTLEMNLSKVESITVDQNPMARIFGYGSITVIGTGGTRELFHNIADPMEFRRQFLSRQP